MKLKLILLALPLAIGCGDNSQPQILTGRVAANFPMPVSTVKVLHGGTIVAQSPVASDGTFTLEVLPQSGLTLRLVGPGKSDVVFPRQAGSIESTFSIRGIGVAFNLGEIRFVGASATSSFAFGKSTTECNDDGEDAGGATCIDDDDQNGGTCEADDGGDNQDGEVDDGEVDDGTNDGETDDDAETADDDGADQGDAVAEHNFPADGCADGGDNGGDNNEQEGEHED